MEWSIKTLLLLMGCLFVLAAVIEDIRGEKQRALDRLWQGWVLAGISAAL